MTEIQQRSRREQYLLPKISCPSLEDLRVEVTAPTPPTADELIERLHQRLRAGASRRERKPGESVELGDEIQCDILTVVDARVVPGGVQHGVRLELREFLHLPGFVEQVLSMTCFSAKSFELTLPAHYPAQDLAGKQASFFVELQRAYEIEQVELDDPMALRAAGLGEDIEQAMESLAAHIDEEQGEELLIAATQVVLDALSDRVSEEIPQAAIEEELRQIWQHSGALVLQKQAFSEHILTQAEQDFLQDPSLREQARRRIATGLALGAIVGSHNLAPSEEIMKLLLSSAAEQVGVSEEQAVLSLRQEPLGLQSAAHAALYQTAVEFVMSRTQVVVVEPARPQ